MKKEGQLLCPLLASMVHLRNRAFNASSSATQSKWMVWVASCTSREELGNPGRNECRGSEDGGKDGGDQQRTAEKLRPRPQAKGGRCACAGPRRFFSEPCSWLRVYCCCNVQTMLLSLPSQKQYKTKPSVGCAQVPTSSSSFSLTQPGIPFHPRASSFRSMLIPPSSIRRNLLHPDLLNLF